MAGPVSDSPPPAPVDLSRHRLRAIAYVCVAVVGFTTIDVCAKWLNPQIGTVQTTFLRYVSGFIWILPFINPWKVPGLLRSERPLLQLVRGLLLLNSTWMNFIAIQYLQLSQTVSIGFMAPLMVSLLAGPILGEWAGPRRLIAIAVGFMGILIITRPGSGAIHSAALLSVLGMFSYACVLLMTRRLTAVDSPETTFFYSSLAGAVILAPIALMSWKAPGTALEWGVVALCGFGGAVGHWMLIQAQRYTDAPVLAPFLYTQIIWMTLSGYLFFGDVPDRWTLLGAAIVIASGLYILHRERVRALESRGWR